MNRKALLYFHRQQCNRAHGLMKIKSQDYGTNASVFENLDACEQVGLSSCENGILIRVQDKLTRLRVLLSKKASVKDESFEDSARDVINYMILLMAKRKSRV